MSDFYQEEYEAEDHQDGESWLGGGSDGNEDPGADPSSHVEESKDRQYRKFEVPARQDKTFAWQDGNEPKIEDFETIEGFQAAEQEYRSRPPTPWADDPLASKRQEIETHIQTYSSAADLAESQGNHARARDMRDIAISFTKDLMDLGSTPQQEFMELAAKGELELLVDFLCDPANIGDPHLNNARTAADAAVIVDKANRTSSGRIALPVEDSDYGTLSPCVPAQMITFELDDQQLDGLREMVYGSGGPTDLDSVFRRSWDYLRQIGVEAAGTRVERAPGRQANADVVGGRRVNSVTQAPDPIRPTGGSGPVSQKDPADMTQKEYERWRGRRVG